MRKIGLLGATGYTGRLTATEFALRDVPVRLGGRSPERLAKVDSIDGTELAVVDTNDRHALDRFLDGLDLVISTVGPFELLGRPVVQAAVDAGVHYIDSTGEPDFIQWAYDTFTNADTAIVPACGYDYIPSDCAASVAASTLDGPPERIEIGYSLRNMRATRGTARSALGAILDTDDAGLRRTTVDGRPAIEMPLGDTTVIPRWAPAATVTCAVTTSKPVSLLVPPIGKAALPMMRMARPLLHRMVERMPEGPSDEQRAAALATVVATASRGPQKTTVRVAVTDVYAFTALALVECALAIDGKGPMSPSQAVDAATLLDSLQGPLLSWRRPAQQSARR
jgi:short subunit dehydrogenase-like uncharacterized protein